MTSLVEQVHRLLMRRRETVAVAESLTGGLLSAALTDTSGASATFRGGLVVYATDLKSTLAGVPLDLLDRNGPVDPAVAVALAIGARQRLAATWGLGVTGVAGPEPQDGVAVGTVYIALAHAVDEPYVERLVLPGDRSAIRVGTVQAALRTLGDTIATRE